MINRNYLADLGVVVLAAGKGTRLNCTDQPKVMLEVAGKPLVAYTIDTLKELGLDPEQICLVVGFYKEKVVNHFGAQAIYAVQEKQLGTAHAAYTGMKIFPPHITRVLVMNGDDGAFYKSDTLKSLIEQHVHAQAVLSLLTADIDNPGSIGRVVRKEDGEIVIVEKESITEEQKKLKEISTNTFVFDRAWYESMFPQMQPIPKLNEFGLPTALAMAKKAGVKYQVIKLTDSGNGLG
jgi:bifunctional UDP-N-acetylglucosamine pyrophosphorylase/glucosamine-1-phosphate N-acetyltransferase